MVDVNIYKNFNDYDTVYIKTDDGDFSISFVGNFDLFWTYHPNKSMLEVEDEHTIRITKENYYLYSCFEQLMEAIRNDTPNSNAILNYDKVKKVPKYNSAKEIGLIKDDVVCWYSDDFPHELASSVSIKQEEEEFNITFKKSSNEEFFQTFCIRFRNNGSSYDPFNMSFMHMYNKLRKYDYQADFKEELYQQKVKKKI